MADDGEGGAPDLRDYGRTVWRQRWVILVTIIVCVGLALALSVAQATVYEATTELIIQPSGTQAVLDPSAENAQNAARNVDTEVAVLRSKAVQDAARRRLGRSADVSVASSATSDVVYVKARSTDARRAAEDANGYGAAYVAYRRRQGMDELLQAAEQIKVKIAEIDTRLPGLREGSPEVTTAEQQRAFLQEQLDQLQVSANLNRVGGARILANADAPNDPVEPRPLRNASIGLVLGLLLGIGLAFLREYLEDGIETRADLERATEGVPVLGQIARVTGWREAARPYLVTLDGPSSPVAEGYRTLRTSLQFLGLDRKLSSIQVTSSNAKEGKTTTVANLGVAFAQAGIRVTIVCCDLRHPRLHEFFGIPNEVGFTSLLLGQASLDQALQVAPGVTNLTVLSAGPRPPNPSELLSMGRARDVIGSLERIADLVIVDSPPVLPVSDALIVSRMVDATLLVANPKVSSRRGLQRSLEMLRQVDAPLIGTVLNNSESVEALGTYDYSYTPQSDNGSSSRRARRQRRERANRAGSESA